MKVNFFTPVGTVVEVYNKNGFVINMAIEPESVKFRIYERSEDEVCMLNVTDRFSEIKDFEDLKQIIDVIEFESHPEFRDMEARFASVNY